MTYAGNNQYSGLTLLERFEQKVELIPFSTCHWWVAALDTYGYGQILVDKVSQRAHRIAYEMYIGKIPDGLQVLHTCDNRSCVNPDHFFLGTNQDNVDDKVKKGRQFNGKNTYILTAADEQKIKEIYPRKTQQRLAAMFNVGQPLISKVIRGARFQTTRGNE